MKVKLNPDAENYRELHDIFATDEIEIRDGEKQQIVLPRYGRDDVYFLELNRLNKEQLFRLTIYLCRRYNLPLNLIGSILTDNTVPIQTKDVILGDDIGK